jgi:catechol 2,3-dioxygenase
MTIEITAAAGAGTTLQSHQTPVHIQSVSLIVRDLDRVSAFYRDIIGLEQISASGSEALLGCGGVPLLLLTHDPDAKPQPEAMPGLFHTAFVLPERRDLGVWLRHIRDRKVSLEGLSDHLVSEAAYLSDPEGNGIEVYTDRPRADWPRDAEGNIRMATLRMDVESVLALSEGRPGGSTPAGSTPAGSTFRMPPGTRIGHVHLCVPDLQDAGALLTGPFGFDKMCSYPQADFYASGGYHHHIAVNTWRTGVIPARLPGYAGLSRVTLAATDAGTHQAMSERWMAAGGLPTDGSLQLKAPSGIVFGLSNS